MTRVRTFFELLHAMLRLATRGPALYWAWLGLLALVVGIGVYAYVLQLRDGFAVTAMTDQVPWGAYIANFTFAVGVIDASVILIIPGLLFDRRELRPLIYLGLFLALAGVVLALLFVVVDIGRPDRAWHLLPAALGGWLTWPRSMLAWDVVVLNGWLVINAAILLRFFWQRFHARPLTLTEWRPALLFASVWAVGLHVVTAFLYTWLSARPFWHSAAHVPRFLTSAFVAGPSFFVISLAVIRRFEPVEVTSAALDSLRRILGLAMVCDLFLVAAEAFTDLFSTSAHRVHMQYLYVGLHGHDELVPYIWTALAMNVTACVIFVVPRLGRRTPLLLTACVLAVIGVWVEKGMGMVIPGFVPGPLGNIVEYSPSPVEIAVCAGVWAVGVLVYTLLLKVGIPLARGEVVTRRIESEKRSPLMKEAAS